jgi:hypothetical protein
MIRNGRGSRGIFEIMPWPHDCAPARRIGARAAPGESGTNRNVGGDAPSRVAQVSQPAVSPISNRQGLEWVRGFRLKRWRRRTDGLQAGSLRYGRLGNLRYPGGGNVSSVPRLGPSFEIHAKHIFHDTANKAGTCRNGAFHLSANRHGIGK